MAKSESTQNPQNVERKEKPSGPLRRGWTTGACATAAAKAALTALLTGTFPDPVTIRLPKGETPAFALAEEELGDDFARAAIVKDAGDDPDVTHLATIRSALRFGEPGSGIVFRAGEGVGMVTKPGLPVGVGEPAINPVPRAMMKEVVETLCAEHGRPADIEITISVPGGEELARHTWNPRLGIVGGISILGTTGVVHPFSCSAWIHSIHRGIDVCRATGVTHALGSTGSTSEAAARRLYDFPEVALLDMGDFVGGLLKYLRDHPVPKLTIAGGFAKMVKFAQGALDLHSGRSQVDMDWLAGEAAKLAPYGELNHSVKQQIQAANTALEVLELTHGMGIDLPESIAQQNLLSCRKILRNSPVAVECIIVARNGDILSRAAETDFMK
ncbi:MAG: cobalt-precorrin-5B (C(1))-methyltransferase [Salaquimonas sp.]|nr:cobalt-precorrin-5B (C(1))-methyltransferase [Salaquimonas sp.]